LIEEKFEKFFYMIIIKTVNQVSHQDTKAPRKTLKIFPLCLSDFVANKFWLWLVWVRVFVAAVL